MIGIITRETPIIILERVGRNRTLRNGTSMILYDKNAGIKESAMRNEVCIGRAG